ncbi:MAG: hypothetical protein ACHQJ6_08365 [Candidatus Berkiellales bacterium]
MIDPNTPKLVQSFLGVEFTLIVFLWFSALSLFLTFPAVKKALSTIQHYVDKVFGCILILFGLKVATLSREF